METAWTAFYRNPYAATHRAASRNDPRTFLQLAPTRGNRPSVAQVTSDEEMFI